MSGVLGVWVWSLGLLVSLWVSLGVCLVVWVSGCGVGVSGGIVCGLVVMWSWSGCVGVVLLWCLGVNW